jgi:acyl dehydratase
MQPVHHDERFAKAAGYDAPLSLGMLHGGLLGTWAASWLGAERAQRFRIRFTAQAFPGDTLTCTGSVAEERSDTVDVELACTTQNGEVVARAWATFALEESS